MNNAKDRKMHSGSWVILALGLLCFVVAGGGVAATESSPEVGSAGQVPPTGPGNVFVTPRFGGYILGWGIDPTGTEGNREQKLQAYREVCDGLVRRIRKRFSKVGAASG